MKAIIKVLTSRWLLLSIAFLMLSLVVWWGGPYLSLGTAQPFETGRQRLFGILWLAVLFVLSEVLRRFKARRASSQLAQDVSQQSAPANQPSAEATQLRARFEEAIAALRSSKGKGFNLYELPWYIIIGPPGVGKTTVIANSGLNFPLAKKFGKEALRGVGGTRNCDWWFTDEAVLLDTAGRYTSQDSEADSDQAGWAEFLSLLRKHRGRRPINGVMVAMSAPDLLSQSEGERARHVQAVRDRLAELGRELKIELPVYLFLTKLDLIAGFTEFFDDFNQEQRGQVWGVTFPLEISRAAQGPELLPDQFDLLLERLNSRLMQRLDGEREVRRRALLFTFPRQFAALRRNLADFVSSTFAAEGAARKLQLRGVYFTSGTQEGTPIDRMIGALARTFGLNMRAVATQQSQGRAYFIQRLLREVLFKESGLAGINRRMELRQGLANVAAYVTVALVLIIGLIGFSVSYRQNRQYLASLNPPVEQLKSLSDELDTTAPLIAGLERLDTFAKATEVAEQHRDDVPWRMRWGLYQGRSLGNAARDAYLRELNAVLLPAIAGHFRDRLLALASEPDKLYEYLKAYVMLGEPRYRDPNQLLYIGNVEWQRVFAEDPATLERFNAHFNALIADADHMQPAKVDAQIIDRARISLAQASLPALMYSRLKLGYVDDKRALNVGNEMALGGDAVFVRKTGVSLSEPFPALYTKPVFNYITRIDKAELVKQFLAERWVLGDKAPSLADSPLLMRDLMQLYEQDYIRAWDELLGDLTIKRIDDPQQAAQQWGLLAAPTSPLKRLLELVRANTALVDATKPKQPGAVEGAVNSAIGSMNRVLGGDTTKQPPVGTTITKHFEQLHRLVQGSPAPIDLTLLKFAALQSAMSQTGVIGGPSALQTANQQSVASNDLAAHAKTLPPMLAGIVKDLTGTTTAVINTNINADFLQRYREVVTECRSLAQGRYPLASNSTDNMTVADFAKVFGPNGTFDTFFRETMQTYVDTSGSTWRWKREAQAVGGPGIPRQFQRVRLIRDVYFQTPGEPKVFFEVTTDYADDNITRATLTVDGQKYEFRNGPTEVPRKMQWPGPEPGRAEFVVVLNSGALTREANAESGPWALYRLLAQATLQPKGDKLTASYLLGGREIRLLIAPASSRNPFRSNPLQGFNCQG